MKTIKQLLVESEQNIESKIERIYDQVGSDYQEAFGDNYPHFEYSIDINKKIFYLQCGKNKKLGNQVKESLGDAFSDNNINFKIELK